MKIALALLLLTSATAPALTHAQAGGPLTRAEDRIQIDEAQRNGTLHPSSVHYPQGLDVASTANSSYGSGIEETSRRVGSRSLRRYRSDKGFICIIDASRAGRAKVARPASDVSNHQPSSGIDIATATRDKHLISSRGQPTNICIW